MLPIVKRSRRLKAKTEIILRMLDTNSIMEFSDIYISEHDLFCI